MTNKDLINNGFVLRYKEVDEYNNTITKKLYYYGPYLYLEKGNVGYRLYSTLSNKPYYETFFDTENTADNVRQWCKDWYMDLNKKFIREIEELEYKRDEIMNYVF